MFPSCIIFYETPDRDAKRRIKSERRAWEVRKGASEGKLRPIMYKSVETGLFHPELLFSMIYVTPERKREREMQESRLKENMWGVSFYLALLAAHSNKVSPAVVSVLQPVYVVTSHWSFRGSSWTGCTAVMSQREAESVRSQSPTLARRGSLKLERIIVWIRSALWFGSLASYLSILVICHCSRDRQEKSSSTDSSQWAHS